MRYIKLFLCWLPFNYNCIPCALVLKEQLKYRKFINILHPFSDKKKKFAQNAHREVRRRKKQT